MIKGIHHINFLVADLEQGIENYEKLGLGPFLRDTLPGRGVETARTKLRDTWFVLVQPTDPNGVPGKHLAKHGEGFFLLSFETDDLEQEKKHLSKPGCHWEPGTTRQGLLNWQVCDLESPDASEVFIQLTQDNADENH